MLKGISPLISPELLATLARMGHGDEIILADAHFPAESFNPRVIRADRLRIPDLLDAIFALMDLGDYVDHPTIMMAPVEGDVLDPAVGTAYLESIRHSHPQANPPGRVDRFAFYERAKSAFAVVMTGETAKYGKYPS